MGEPLTTSQAQILKGFRRGTEFMMYPGVAFKADKSVQNINRSSLEYNVVMGNIMEGDYYILRAIYELGFATTSALLTKLFVEQRRNPEVQYPFKDYASLRARLEFLTQFGLLFCHTYLDRTETFQYIYFCSSEGWRAYKNMLCSTTRYDNNRVYEPPFEVFRKVCANAVLCAFGESEKCRSIVGACEAVYRDGDRDRKAYLYGRATVEDGVRKARYIIEPVHFVTDEKVLSHEENKRRISERLTQLEGVVRYYNTRDVEPIDTYLILVLENEEGLKELTSIIRSKDVSFYVDRCLYTNEYVVTRGASGKVSEALLGMIIKEGGIISFGKKNLTVNLNE